MLAQRGKDLFIDVLKYNIDLGKNGCLGYGLGALESLEDVLEKAQDGMFDSIFEYPFLDEANDDFEESASSFIYDECKRWSDMATDYEKFVTKVVSHMTETERLQCKEKYKSTSRYMWDRHYGYDIAIQILNVTTCC